MHSISETSEYSKGMSKLVKCQEESARQTAALRLPSFLSFQGNRDVREGAAILQTPGSSSVQVWLPGASPSSLDGRICPSGSSVSWGVSLHNYSVIQTVD